MSKAITLDDYILTIITANVALPVALTLLVLSIYTQLGHHLWKAIASAAKLVGLTKTSTHGLKTYVVDVHKQRLMEQNNVVAQPTTVSAALHIACERVRSPKSCFASAYGHGEIALPGPTPAHIRPAAVYLL